MEEKVYSKLGCDVCGDEEARARRSLFDDGKFRCRVCTIKYIIAGFAAAATLVAVFLFA